jgi:hypothetical protein
MGGCDQRGCRTVQTSQWLLEAPPPTLLVSCSELLVGLRGPKRNRESSRATAMTQLLIKCGVAAGSCWQLRFGRGAYHQHLRLDGGRGVLIWVRLTKWGVGRPRRHAIIPVGPMDAWFYGMHSPVAGGA